jgi:hypothetical protein
VPQSCGNRWETQLSISALASKSQSQSELIIHNNSQLQSSKQGISKLFEIIELVVVMSAVNLWKAQELQPHNSVTDSLSKWRFVGIAEISDLAEKFPVNFRIWSTPINRFSALFSYFLHK